MTTARYEVLNLSLGDERYEQVLGQIRDDVHLRSRMWADAEHRFEEIPGKVWTVVLARQNDRQIPAAWAAGTVQHVGGEPVLLCSDNYERRGPGRQWGLYKEAYRHRHATLVTTSTFPMLTYLFAEPIPLHEADGWRRTGLSGVSREPGNRPTRVVGAAPRAGHQARSRGCSQLSRRAVLCSVEAHHCHSEDGTSA